MPMTTIKPAAQHSLLSNSEQSLLKPLDDVVELVQWISDLTGQSVHEVALQMREEVLNPGYSVGIEIEKQGITPHLWSEELIQFYQSTNSFLYSSSVWNASTVKLDICHWMGEFFQNHLKAGARILAFGDGMGFDSAYLAQLGFSVDCFEVSEEALKFAQRLFEANDVDVNIVTDESQLVSGTYDAIICLDVLEHVPDPPEVVEKFSRWIRPGGYLVVHNPFCYVTPMLHTHLDSNRKYSGDTRKLFRPFGFKPVECSGNWRPLALQQAGAEEPHHVSFRDKMRLLKGKLLLYPARISAKPYTNIAAKHPLPPHPEWLDAIENLIEQTK